MLRTNECERVRSTTVHIRRRTTICNCKRSERRGQRSARSTGFVPRPQIVVCGLGTRLIRCKHGSCWWIYTSLGEICLLLEVFAEVRGMAYRSILFVMYVVPLVFLLNRLKGKKALWKVLLVEPLHKCTIGNQPHVRLIYEWTKLNFSNLQTVVLLLLLLFSNFVFLFPFALPLSSLSCLLPSSFHLVLVHYLDS